MQAMDASIFIVLAYVATGVLLGALCVTSWLSARTVAQQLNEQSDR
jgi:heme exporter protein CcmD